MNKGNHAQWKLLERVIAAIVILIAAGSVSAQPQTITVTSPSCRGPGSLDEAVTTANQNPGSTIRIPSSVTVKLSTCRGAVRDPAYTIIQNTIIEGDYTPLPNGDPDFSGPTAITGPQKSFTPDGNLNLGCPSRLDQITAQSPGLFGIGSTSNDNTGLIVTIRKIRLADLPWLFVIRKDAGVVVEDSFLDQIRNKNYPCHETLVSIDPRGSFKLTNTVVNEAYYEPITVLPDHVIPDGAIFGNSPSTIQLDRVKWFGSGGTNVVYAGIGSNVDIVSSWFDDVGGFMNSGGTWHMVNSVWSAKSPINQFTPFSTYGTGAITIIEASTLRTEGAGCSSCFAKGHPIQAFWGGRVELKSTVIGGSNFSSQSSGAVISDTPGGSVTADDKTWIQPSFLQDATALRAITAQPNLLTDPPGIKTTSSGLDSILDKSQPLVPSVLLDIVDNTTTPLLNPINNQPITLDVFGSPRLDGNRRDAGAVQIGSFNNPSFTITALVSNRGDGRAALSWTRPMDPPGSTVEGYKVQSRVTGTTPWLTFANIPQAGSLQTTVSGLTNGILYEFQVVPYNASSVDGPPSNVVSAIPFGLPGAPTMTPVALPGEVKLTWTAPNDNGSPLTGYTVLYRVTGQLNNWNVWPYSNFPTREVIVSGLTNGVTYEFAVAGLNSAGTGPNGAASETPRKLLYLSYPEVTGYLNIPLTFYPTYANVYGTPTYTVITGTLPPGMNLSQTTGEISGTPSSSGTFDLTIQLTDSASGSSVMAPVKITISPNAATLTGNYDNYTGPVGTTLGAPLRPNVTGATGSLSFTLDGGDPLPAGLTLNNSTGEISGTPTTATGSVFSLTMKITDSNGFTLEPLEIEITPTLLYTSVVGQVGNPFSVSPTVSPGVQAGTFALALGSTLPPGLSLDPSSGTITGTPTQVSKTSVTVEYRTGLQIVSNQFEIQVNGYWPSLTYPPFTGQPGQAVFLSPTVTGTKGTLAFTSATALPDGLTLNGSTGMITGVLPQSPPGAVAFQIIVTDQYQQQASASASFTIVVTPPRPVNPIPTLSEWAQISMMLSMLGIMGWSYRRVRR